MQRISAILLAATLALGAAAVPGAARANPAAGQDNARVVPSASATAMPFADADRLAAMGRLLRETRATPAESWERLPPGVTLAESRLLYVLAYLKSVRPTDGGNGPTGAQTMAALVRDAVSQYQGYLARRLPLVPPRD